MSGALDARKSPWERHCDMMRQYGAAKQAHPCKTDLSVLREEYKFIQTDSYKSEWGRKLVVAYCERLYKEYALVNLDRYTQGIGMRWRIESEVVAGKGQFSCGGIGCATPKDALSTLEVPFAYKEGGAQHEALVKVRLCRMCRYKLEYRRNEKKRKRGEIASNDPPQAHAADEPQRQRQRQAEHGPPAPPARQGATHGPQRPEGPQRPPPLPAAPAPRPEGPQRAEAPAAPSTAPTPQGQQAAAGPRPAARQATETGQGAGRQAGPCRPPEQETRQAGRGGAAAGGTALPRDAAAAGSGGTDTDTQRRLQEEVDAFFAELLP